MKASPKILNLSFQKGPVNMMTVKKTYEFDPKQDLIGRGGFGSVYRARDLNLGIEVAIKKYSGQLPAKYSLFEEIKRAIQLNHPNLIRYYDAYELEETNAFGDKIQVGVLEYANGGDLYQFMQKKHSPEVWAHIFEGIMLGLQYLHSNDIIHRDLKPENVLLHHHNEQLIPKIADFGISKVLEKSSTPSSSLIIGTIAYMAPEQFSLSKYGNNGQLHTNLDLWSLGTIMYEAFTGSAPFGKTEQGVSRNEVMRNILDKDVDGLDRIPEPFREIVRRCLVKNATDRIQRVDELLWLLEEHNESRKSKAAYKPVFKEPLNTAVLREKVNQLQKENPALTESVHLEPEVPRSRPIPEDQLEEAQVAANPTTTKKSKSSLSPAMIIPILTAIIGFAGWNMRANLFGGDGRVGEMLLYPGIICALLMLVNVISILLRKNKQGFEWLIYTFSFLVLVYFFGQSILTYQYANIPGFVFDFANHSFAKLFPFMAALAMLGATAMTYMSRKRPTN